MNREYTIEIKTIINNGLATTNIIENKDADLDDIFHAIAGAIGLIAQVTEKTIPEIMSWVEECYDVSKVVEKRETLN